MSDAKRCPVCDGRGSVPAGFYTPGQGATDTASETCRTCGGNGMVVVEGATQSTAPGDPLDLTYRG